MHGIPALEISDMHAWDGDDHVLRGINLRVEQGEVVGLLGPHGASQAMRAMLGLTATRKGSMRVHNTESIHLPTEAIRRLGIAYFPDGVGIFTALTCEENLLAPAPFFDNLGGGMSLTEIYGIFPSLEVNRHVAGARLSEGEQQLLALARILRSGADLLLLDEASAQAAPVVVRGLARMVRALKEKTYTVVIVQQKLEPAILLADRYYVFAQGRIVEQFGAPDLPSSLASPGALLGA